MAKSGIHTLGGWEVRDQQQRVGYIHQMGSKVSTTKSMGYIHQKGGRTGLNGEEWAKPDGRVENIRLC